MLNTNSVAKLAYHVKRFEKIEVKCIKKGILEYYTYSLCDYA